MVGRAPPAAGMVGSLLVIRHLSERRLVGEPAITSRVSGPRVIAGAPTGGPTIPALATRAGLAAAAAAAAAAAEAAAAAAPA